MKESKVVDGVQEIELDSWVEFLDLTRANFVSAPAYVYRGQANYDWPLRTSIDRLEREFPKRTNLAGKKPEYFNRPPLSHMQQLNAFKRAVRGRRGSTPASLQDDEYWALGQHYGLATPLLDWTRSPFAALFFAFEEESIVLDNSVVEPKYRGVFVLSTSTIEIKAGDNKVSLVSSDSDENYRLIGQAGLFVKMPRQTDLEPYVKENFAGEEHNATLIKVKIPNIGRSECLIMLNKMNINDMTAYPDIEGAAKYVNSLWQPGHEDSIANV